MWLKSIYDIYNRLGPLILTIYQINACYCLFFDHNKGMETSVYMREDLKAHKVINKEHKESVWRKIK